VASSVGVECVFSNGLVQLILCNQLDTDKAWSSSKCCWTSETSQQMFNFSMHCVLT